jgi:glutamyl-tRNA reductase
MTRQIFAAEINFEDAPFNIREKFNASEANVKTLLNELRPRVDEVYILATRQRFTVYVVHENLHPLTDFFHSENNLKGYVQYYYNTGESVTHLMATASGLLSSVKGEANILSDIIQCYQWATVCSCLGATLDNTVTRTIETGRKVRVATAIDHFCSSVVETGLELLYSRLENLHRKNFLVIGTGKLARLALEYLCKEGMTNIAITGHDHKVVLQLAKKYSVKSFPIESIGDYFFMADVIIGVSHEELEMDFTSQQQTKDQNKNCFILDFGMPPNFNSQWVERHAAEFYNLDDLRRLQPSPLEYFGGLELAWRMVMKASNDFVLLINLLQHSPVLAAYLDRQFIRKNGGSKRKSKRSLKHIFLFKKGEAVTGISADKEAINTKVHVNNHRADNGHEIIRNFSHVKRFQYLLSDN